MADPRPPVQLPQDRLDLPPDGQSQAEVLVIAALQDTNVVVTGGCGFIGINLVTQLLAERAKVTVVDRAGADWGRLPEPVGQVKADLLDVPGLTGACEGAEVIFHLAARTDIDGTQLEDYRVNYEGTANVIDACATGDSAKRFVFYSTQLTVGLFNETRFIDESEPYRTQTAYGRSKIEGERIVRERCGAAGIDYTIIRPTSVYGPWGEEPYREFFRVIKRRRYVHVGKAANLVSWVYVKNLVELTILASRSPAARNETYFANDFHPYTMREIVDAVAGYYGIAVRTVPSPLVTGLAYALALPKRWGLNVPIYPFRLRNIRANYCYDIQRSVALGFMPEYDLRRGVRETLDWYEGRGLL